jgi:hypothetical protein
MMISITTEDFDKFLMQIVAEQSSLALLHIPGIYEILCEEFNNDVIRLWEQTREETEEEE